MANFIYPPIAITISGGATAAKQDDQIVLETAILADTASIDGKITACDTDKVTIDASALPTGASIESKQDSIITELQSIKNNQASISPVDFLDSGLIDTNSTNITTAGLQVVASLADDCVELEIQEDIGEYMAITDGSDVVLSYPPLGGGRVKLSISAGTVIKIRSLTGSDISIGKIAINFLG